MTADWLDPSVTDDAPTLIFSYFHEVDVHNPGEYDPANAYYQTAIENTDAGIGTILNALEERLVVKTDEEWLVVVGSDHGVDRLWVLTEEREQALLDPSARRRRPHAGSAGQT